MTYQRSNTSKSRPSPHKKAADHHVKPEPWIIIITSLAANVPEGRSLNTMRLLAGVREANLAQVERFPSPAHLQRYGLGNLTVLDVAIAK